MKAPLLTRESSGGSRIALQIIQLAPPDVRAKMSATVCAHVQLHARRIRITFGGADVAAFVHTGGAKKPANWIKLFMPTPAGGSVGRAYTLRTLDTAAGTFDVDFVIHKTGAASRWAQAAQVGDAVAFAGPRDGGFNLLARVQRLLLIGDATALSAIQAILSDVPSDLPVEALLVVDHPEEYEPPVARPHVRVHWIGSTEDEADELDALENAFDKLPASLSPCQVWMAGESRIILAARRLLNERWAMEEARIHSKIYWKRGTSHFRT